jgi:hypothetical protein
MIIVILQKFRSTQVLGQSFLDLWAFHFEYRLAGHQSEVVSRGNPGQQGFDGCSHQAFGSVSLYGFTHRFPGCQTDSRSVKFVWQGFQYNKRVGIRLTETPHPLKVG